MKKIMLISVLLAMSLRGYAVSIETTANLNVYYPEYSKIDLVCGQMQIVFEDSSRNYAWYRDKDGRVKDGRA